MSERNVSITILNTLDRPLELIDSTIEAEEAISFPSRIEAGESGKYSVKGHAEVSFCLRDVPPKGESMLGTCSISVSIPLVANNTSKLDTTGVIGQVGYEPISPHGYSWTRTITLFSKLDKPDVTDETATKAGYGWEAISALPELSDADVDIQSVVPEKYVFSDQPFGRSETLEIPEKYWTEIKDPLFDEYGQRTFVTQYFAVAVYRLKKNTSVSIAADQSYSKEVMVQHRSSTRSEVSQEMNLENALRLDREGICEELRSTYRISQMTEYCDESEKNVTERLEYSAVEYDRDVVIWDLDKIICIFRKNINGKIGSIGLSDYYVASTAKTYAQRESEE